MLRETRQTMSDVDPVLDGRERSLVERSLAWLRPKQPHESAALWNHVKRVARLGEVLDQTPTLAVGGDALDLDKHEAELVERLAHVDPMGRELVLPEKAHVARAFALAKIAMLRDFKRALDPAGGGDTALHAEMHGELAQSVYTLIATEILTGLLSDQLLAEHNRRRAARQLILIWERAALLEIDDFCPMLEAAWRARSRVGVHFGALVGAGEYMRLVQSDCPAEFLDFFVRDDAVDDEVQAFEEFLFNLPFEDLTKLRAASKERGNVIDRAAAEEILGRSMAEAATTDDPDSIYRAYSRRRTAAEFRQWIGAPGPRRTAEAYIMTQVLEGTDRFATSEFHAYKG
jgi:hypothetical protein